VVLRRLAHNRAVRHTLGFLTRPGIALTLWVVIHGAWHIPRAYDYVLTHQTAHNLEHATFMLAGLLVWTQLIDPAHTGRLSVGHRLGVAVFVFAMGTLLWYILIFTP
jgi:putative membrane protein